MKIDIISCVPVQIPYLGKILFLRFRTNHIAGFLNQLYTQRCGYAFLGFIWSKMGVASLWSWNSKLDYLKNGQMEKTDFLEVGTNSGKLEVGSTIWVAQGGQKWTWPFSTFGPKTAVFYLQIDSDDNFWLD